MINLVYASIAISMVIFWLALGQDDDDHDGGKLIPAYQHADK